MIFFSFILFVLFLSLSLHTHKKMLTLKLNLETHNCILLLKDKLKKSIKSESWKWNLFNLTHIDIIWDSQKELQNKRKSFGEG